MLGLEPITWLAIVGALALGAIFAMVGQLRESLALRLEIEPEDAGKLLAAVNLSLIPAIFVAGILVDTWGIKHVLCLGAVLTAVSFVAMALSRSYSAYLGSILMTGAGLACFNVSVCVLMPYAFFPNAQSASVNLGFVFVGLGALLAPRLYAPLERAIQYRRALTLTALAFLLPAFFAALVAVPAAAPAPMLDIVYVIENPLLWVAALVFLLYSALEGMLGISATQYLQEQRFSKAKAEAVLTGVWIAFLLSRLLAAYLQHQQIALSTDSDPWLILILAVLAAVALGNLVGAHDPFPAAFGVIAVGFLLGPVLPTLIGFLFKNYSFPGTSYGTVFACGAFGNLLFAPLHRTAQKSSLIVLTGAALLLALFAVGLAALG